METTLEDILSSEIQDYLALSQEASEKIGPVGKPLTHRYMALEMIKRITGSMPAETVIPPTIQLIVKKVSVLESSCGYLKCLTVAEPQMA